MLSKTNFLVVHADWSTSPSKRWMARSALIDGHWISNAPEPVGPPPTLLERLRSAVGQRGTLLLGFDFPIGLPFAYAQKIGVDDFLSILPRLGHGEWRNFYTPATSPGEISLLRPFYPARPGSALQTHLLHGLGLVKMDELRRLCELAHFGRRAASPLFWTLGGQQVGKAAITGWREMLGPALQALPQVVLWPFAGPLEALLQEETTVVAETYPAEFYTHLGISRILRQPVKSGSASQTRRGKRSQESRRACCYPLLDWAQEAGVSLRPELETEIRTGFGPTPQAEDRFDAVIGLFGMLNILLGHHPAGPPPGAISPNCIKIEGWIFGQDENPV